MRGGGSLKKSFAINFDWQGNETDSWNNATQWSPVGVPGTADTILVFHNKTLKLKDSDEVSVHLFLTGQTFSSSATGSQTGTVQVEGGATVKTGDNIVVGRHAAQGYFYLKSGTVSSGTNLYIGYANDPLTTNLGYMEQTGGTLTVTQSLEIGGSKNSNNSYGNGKYLLTDGTVTARELIVGHRGGVGELEIEGGNLNASNFLTVGWQESGQTSTMGSGVVTQTGGTVTIGDGSGTLYVGAMSGDYAGFGNYNSNGKGTYKFSGGNLNIGGVILGAYVGDGTLEVSGGSLVIPAITAGNALESRSALIVSGGELTVNSFARAVNQLTVSGTGILNIQGNYNRRDNGSQKVDILGGRLNVTGDMYVQNTSLRFSGGEHFINLLWSAQGGAPTQMDFIGNVKVDINRIAFSHDNKDTTKITWYATSEGLPLVDSTSSINPDAFAGTHAMKVGGGVALLGTSEWTLFQTPRERNDGAAWASNVLLTDSNVWTMTKTWDGQVAAQGGVPAHLTNFKIQTALKAEAKRGELEITANTNATLRFEESREYGWVEFVNSTDSLIDYEVSLELVGLDETSTLDALLKWMEEGSAGQGNVESDGENHLLLSGLSLMAGETDYLAWDFADFNALLGGNVGVGSVSTTAVPEPMTWLLLGLGWLGILWGRKKK